MAEAEAKYNMKICPLSVSFRCPSEIVKNAQWRVPHFKWFKEGGKVERLEKLALGDFPSDATIICRNNAPLFKLAMQFLSNSQPVTVHGSDIGPKVIGIMRNLGDGSLRRPAVISSIEDWRDRKLAAGSTTAGDIADCMKVFATYGDTLDQAIKYAEHLFLQTGSINLLTGHKSKGLEFEKVYLLDTHLLRENDQDLNLRYVMQTRSKNELYEINSATIEGNVE
jgi:hypothetical protein